MNPTPTERDHQSEEQLSLLQTITMEVAAADHFSSALEVVLRRVCEKTGWVLGQAWVPNHDGTALDCGSVCFCGNGELGHFRAASEASLLGLGVGFPGACGSRSSRHGLRTSEMIPTSPGRRRLRPSG